MGGVAVDLHSIHLPPSQKQRPRIGKIKIAHIIVKRSAKSRFFSGAIPRRGVRSGATKQSHAAFIYRLSAVHLLRLGSGWFIDT